MDEKKLKALAAELTKGMTPREIVATFEKWSMPIQNWR